ncbi:helix-hairpin-helix domain-containing protein [Candidatus Nitrosocosmicus franklandus]|uniref:DNA polymerase beta n=1 Tax=Candidatus Nitrosocosmicus franklandianus TaxID=1798806 RepID=A0A484IA52_9ARCH|nr:helix-hairpin-helix domain-containing protein [Candidatus Nitrosocosmicus franklandus]VFJ14612.1 DNA polymerase/3'-5' exonuclease PolX [Candidatus Nitrosocosmicus franklandus]
MTISNAEVAKVLRKIAFLVEMDSNKEDESINFKNRAYLKAADQIENLPVPIEKIYKESGLKGLLQIPMIGKAISSKIEEFLNTGKIEYYEKLRIKYPIEIDEFLGLEGIGPKTLRTIMDRVPVKNIKDLENLIKEEKLRTIPGFSQKKESNLLKKIESHRKGKSRSLLGDLYPLVAQIEDYLVDQKKITKIIVVGSFRRMKETIGDIDILVVSRYPAEVINYFTKMPNIDEVLSQGTSKAFVRLNNGTDVDLLVVPEDSFGSASLYFTGSKEHGIVLRKIAQMHGYRLNEWGLFDNSTGQKLAGESESEIYNRLDLEWIPPEMRENQGEIQMAKKGSKIWQQKIQNLISYESLKGDLQVHSSNTDGQLSVEEMAFYARTIFGLDYIAITDHTKSLSIARGLDEHQLLDQSNEISEINDRIKSGEFFSQENRPNITKHLNKYLKESNAKNSKNSRNKINGTFKILTAAEVNILKDGSLDISNNVLDKLDIVGAAIHSNFNLSEDIQTERLIKAAQNPSVDIIFHPTGRIINKREGYPINISKLLSIALETDTILEIDAHYNRLDLKDEHIRMAIEKGVKLVIDSDAHHPLHYTFLKFGIAQARRGWAERGDILNTLSANDLLKNLK